MGVSNGVKSSFSSKENSSKLSVTLSKAISKNSRWPEKVRFCFFIFFVKFYLVVKDFEAI